MLNKINSISQKDNKNNLNNKVVSGALFALLTNPANAGVFEVDMGNNWQNNEKQEQTTNSSNKSINYYQQELEKAKEKLSETQDYSKKREIMQYIQMLEETIQQKRQNSPADEIIEHREYAEYPREIHFDIKGGLISMNTLETDINSVDDVFNANNYSIESGSKNLSSYGTQGGDLSLSKGESIKGELRFGKNGRYPEEFEIQYDGQAITIKAGEYSQHDTTREYKSKPIPATPSNRGINTIYLYQGYDNQKVGAIKINLDWRE